MRRILILLFTLITFCIAKDLSAQVEGKTYSIFNEENNWSGTTEFVCDILLGSEDMLWLATHSKLIRWDGQHKRIYDAIGNDGFQIDGKKVDRLYERDSATLVLLTQKEKIQVELLNKKDRKSRIIPFVKNNEVIKEGYLADLFQTKEGEIYGVLNHQNTLGIYQLIQDRFVWIRTVDFEMSIDQKTIKVAFMQNAFWIGIESLGVWKCEKKTQEKVMTFTAMIVEASPALKFLHADKKDRLWLGLDANKKLFEWNSEKYRFHPSSIPDESTVNTMKEDANGNLLFVCGTYPRRMTAAYLYAENKWTNYSNLLNPLMISLFPNRDLTQSLLAFTSNNIQVVELKKEGVQSYLNQTLATGKYGTIIKGVNEDRKGNIYFLSEINEFYKLDIQTNEVVQIPILDENGKEISFRCGGAIHQDDLGYLWFKACNAAAKGLLVKFDPQLKQFQIFSFEGLIRDIDINAENELWMAQHSFNDKKGRLTKFDFKTQTFTTLPLTSIDGETTFAEPRFVKVSNDTTIWIGTIKGLVKVNPVKKKFEIYSVENSVLKNDYIITIHEEENGGLILGSAGGGLYIFDPVTLKLKNYNKKNGLVGNYVCGILPIDSSHYWLSTFSGISYWDQENELFFNVDQTEGLSHSEFNRYAFHKSIVGEYYFGNVNGVNRFRTEQLIGTEEVPRLGISRLTKYFGNADTFDVQKYALEQIDEIVIYPDVTYLEFDFFINDFARAKNSTVLTKLQGYDDKWVPLSSDKKVRYRLLPMGTYELLVKAYSAKGVKVVNELKVKIISKNYFYKTWWFSLSMMTLLLGLSWWWSYRQLEKQKGNELEKAQINRRFADLELQALQAQLNPHFIFNALGAIQYYIQVSNVEAADIYLTRFAQLMRKYLDSSKEKMISVKDEIDLLQIYSELEQLRFDHSFKVDIKADEDLYLEDTYLPSVMIQPFVENAINHGLSGRKDKEGKLEIHFYEKGDLLFCEIKDNGIGRENASKNKRKGHQSRGMTIIDEKIQTLKMSGLMDIKVKTTDLFMNAKKFPGTKVVLQFLDLTEDQM